MAGPAEIAPDSTAPPRLRFEVLLALGWLLFGLVVLPALIYLVGTVLLGAYGGGGRLGSFYGDLIRDLAGGSPRAWILIMGPLVLVELGRLIFSRFAEQPRAPRTGSKQKPPTSGSNSFRPQTEIRERREPTIKF